MSEKSKFKFSCSSDCGKCCDDREPVPLILNDLEAWASKKIIKNMFPYIKIRKDENGLAELVLNMLGTTEESENKNSEDGSSSGDDAGEDLEKQFVADTVAKGKCPMLNKESKTCLIWDNRPTYCRAFPLGFDDGSFFIEMDDCPGIDSVEDMDKDLLKMMREDAKRVFDGKKQVGIVMPLLQALVLNSIQEANMKAMSKMSPEDLQKLQDVFEKMSKKE
ncbi:MAG TPA: YkgJ family cysteine cluster protein [Candidatus Lokiarchaeia archaeon]|nr:YkgJ family cysteine cluster protein [Candidatus Lokiarchaeia archaeon]